MKCGLRFDRFMADNVPWGYNGTMRYNVIWKTNGVSVSRQLSACILSGFAALLRNVSRSSNKNEDGAHQLRLK